MASSITITPDESASFVNNAAFCVGTGRIGLGLQAEYQEQLRQVQKLCHFRYMRGHGLFHDDMSIYQDFTTPDGVRHKYYCFTYLDRIMDAYREIGIKPFLELGFMPGALASSEQTLFYWKAHTVPPKSEEDWVDLVKATLAHLRDRYGEDEVSTWPCEIWNEPNLPGFWEHADKEKYLRLYEITSQAVKAVLPRMQVGGPAVCGGPVTNDWVRDFLTFCLEKQLPVDFVTRHAYMAKTPDHRGRYIYHEMCEVEETLEEMRGTREVIDSFPEFRGMPMHITEFNTSYNPRCPIHDTPENACHIAGLLACLGDVAASYSYWTFGDVFEETGVPVTPFHGGFGMMADQCIPKPTLWAFSFFNNLSGSCVHRDAHSVVMRRADGSFEGVVWNLQRKGREALGVTLALPVAGRAVLQTRTVDEEHGNPLALWHAMGEPASLTEEQLSFLRESARPWTQARTGEDQASWTLTLAPNAITHFTLSPAPLTPDEGYDYRWYCAEEE